jgi:ferredoxin
MAETTTEKKKKKNRAGKRSWIRRVVQIGFFLFVLAIVATQYLKNQGITLPWSAPNLHAICPFGAVETTGRIITQGSFVPKTHESNYWVLLATIGATLLFGAVFCGWLCPLGSIQDWIGKLGKRLLKKRYNRIPVKLDRALSYLRYVVLALVVIQTTRLVNLVFVRVDPYYALFHFWTGEALPSAMIVLAAVLAASLFVARPWCRWFCPFGALQGLLQLLSPWKIRRNEASCIDCGACTRVCPMGINVCKKSAVYDTRCNRCGECLAACPVEGCLDHSLPKRKLSLKSGLVTAALILSLFIAPIFIAEQTGLFKTSNGPTVTAGKLQAEDIKSSHTLQQVAEGFGIDLNTLLEHLSLPASVPGSTKIRDLEDIDESVTIKTVRSRMERFI